MRRYLLLKCVDTLERIIYLPKGVSTRLGVDFGETPPPGVAHPLSTPRLGVCLDEDTGSRH